VIGTTVQHYRIGERLGAGGMGEVYRAEDVRLGRPVALKFLSANLKADPESRARLLNEARAASQLRSPNIAVTYDIGEYRGSDFIVMEYVDGELLSSRVSRGALPIREAINVGLQVAEALEEAHNRGIVHRDIKSGNLMRTDRGLVKVLDFGLAKFVPMEHADSTSAITQPQVTMAGMVIGTVSYMAPEQALGRTVDHRADLFSLGVVLFELSTGRMPFVGASPTEIIDRILHELPPAPSRFNNAIPASFDAVVARALEKSPTFRYQSAREIREDLQQVARELDGTGRPATGRITSSVAVPQPAVTNSVAVMTFANITREPADDWIGTGIAETVSSDLKKVQITSNVIDVATGEVRKTVKVDGRIGDIFELQDKIVYGLSHGLNVALEGTEIAGIERQETRSVEAYESYARGMMNLRLATRDSMERAIAAFEDATRLDPDYAMAWAALGGAYALKGSFLSLQDLVLKGVEVERRALQIDPKLADAHVWLGSGLLTLGRVDEAIESIQEGIRLEP
jgi:non-specific serine/threonine protein kinase